MKFILNILLAAVIILLTSFLLSGVHVAEGSYFIALVVALVLAVLNALVKPIIVFLTIPLTILSLGLFLLVINAIIIMLADALVRGFEVDSFWWALLFSIIVSIIMSIFGSGSKK